MDPVAYNAVGAILGIIAGILAFAFVPYYIAHYLDEKYNTKVFGRANLIVSGIVCFLLFWTDGKSKKH